MTLKDLRVELLARLADSLAPTGYYRREQSFRCDTAGGWVSLHVAIINHRDDFDVTADVAVRYNAVEEARADRQRLSARERRETATVGAQLANIAGIGTERWTVRAPADIAPAVLGILASFDRVGRPFLERFTELPETLRVLDADGPEARLICPLPGSRSTIRDTIRTLLGSGAV
jgi:hypothetical protein